ncbi:MAG: tetratricopeptide repeat protein [Acidobacteriia bacterium]|nr:tetratricopeptide repeat protein [Terriglobia bacterium]
MKQYDRAREVLEQSLSVTPVHPEIYGLLFTLMLRSGDSSGVMTYEGFYLERTRELGYRLDSAYALLAAVCAAEGFDEHAAGYYRAAISLEPAVAWYHDSLGNILFRRGDLPNAQGEYLRAHMIDSMSPNAHRMLGRILESQGMRADAIHYYREYLRLDSAGKEAIEVRKSVVRLNQNGSQ